MAPIPVPYSRPLASICLAHSPASASPVHRRLGGILLPSVQVKLTKSNNSKHENTSRRRNVNNFVKVFRPQRREMKPAQQNKARFNGHFDPQTREFSQNINNSKHSVRTAEPNQGAASKSPPAVQPAQRGCAPKEQGLNSTLAPSSKRNGRAEVSREARGTTDDLRSPNFDLRALALFPRKKRLQDLIRRRIKAAPLRPL
jgi:hypothetical protein